MPNGEQERTPSIRQRPQARLGPLSSELHRTERGTAPGPEDLRRESDAERWLTLAEAQIFNGDWTDSDRAKVRLGDYGATWIEERPDLRPRTVELYRWLLRKYIAPHLGGVQLGKLSTSMVREWRTKLLDSGVSATMAAKAYRLLRAVLMTAVVEDKILSRNPCQVRGGRHRGHSGAADPHGSSSVRTGRTGRHAAGRQHSQARLGGVPASVPGHGRHDAAPPGHLRDASGR